VKRSGNLVRRTPLQSRTPLARTGWEALDRQPRQRAAHTPRATGEAAARRLVYARSGGLCERCGRQTAVQWHHRQNRSQGGLWEAANGLHLDVECHLFVGTNPTASYAAGWLVRSGQNPAEAPVWHARFGLVLLDNSGGWSAVIPREVES
jgi:hypothetical protein